MKKRVPVIITVALCIICSVITFQITSVYMFLMDDSNNSDVEKMIEKLRYIDSIFSENDIKGVNYKDASDYAMYGYVYGCGDEYAEYCSADEYDSYINELNGDNVGIGVLTAYDEVNSELVILKVYSGTPAEDAGLKAGDCIVGINGKTFDQNDYYDVVNEIPTVEDTELTLQVLKDGNMLSPKEIKIKTVWLEDHSITYEILETDHGKHGYIQVTAFNSYTADSFKKAIEDCISQGVDDFIFDLRSNGGGITDTAISMLDVILPECSLGFDLYVNDEEEIKTSDANSVDQDIVILVNGESASCSEFFSVCLRDYDKAKLIGTKTYGKGCGQSVVPLSDGSAIKLTTFTYKPPKSEIFDGIGLSPDIEVELDEKCLDYYYTEIPHDIDNQLSCAIEYLENN